MGDRLKAFEQSRPGQFVKKVMDDRVPNLAVPLAWGTLNTLFPLFLGMLAISWLNGRRGRAPGVARGRKRAAEAAPRGG